MLLFLDILYNPFINAINVYFTLSTGELIKAISSFLYSSDK